MFLNVALLVSVLVLVAGLALLWRMRARRQELRLPAGERIYEDTQEWSGKILYSEEHGLNGKPDFLFQHGPEIIPVEVKMGKTPRRPYWGHIMQLMAYCLLVEVNYQTRPAYGVIRYPENEFMIEFTPERQAALLEILADMWEKRRQAEVRRSHNNPRVCAACGFYDRCEERLDS